MGAGLSVAVAGCPTPSASPDVEGFEDGLGDWEPEAAIGPEVDVEDFDWEVDISDATHCVDDLSVTTEPR